MTRELAHAACTSHELRTAALVELEARVRAQVNLSWFGAAGVSAEVACAALPHVLSKACVNADGEPVFAPRCHFLISVQ